jgi:hypothetical protein
MFAIVKQLNTVEDMAPGLLISTQETLGFRGFQRPILATPECVQLSGFWTGVSGVLIRETVLKIRRIHQVDGLSINAIANVAVPDSSSKTCSARVIKGLRQRATLRP